MSKISADKVQVFENDLSELDILKKLTEERKTEEPFQILNIGDILRKHKLWYKKLPKIIPYYAVKCNPDPTLIKVIAALGGNFDCASKNEIAQVLNLGISADRIIYAHPIKFKTHIEYARKVNVMLMTVDTEDELNKIKEIHPKSKIVIRIRCDDKSVKEACLGEKYGCDPNNEAVKLIKTTIDLELELHGFSFHVGSPCQDVSAICRGIQLCSNLINLAKAMGIKNVKMIDIGGGIPGERNFDFDKFSESINSAIENLDSSITIIAEPGRYYVTSAFTSAATVIGKKTILKEHEKSYEYYVSDGVYGSFIEELLEIKRREPVPLSEVTDNKRYISTIWGPTCDSYDCIVKKVMLPEFQIGEWLAWLEVGSYSRCLSSEFNGFQPPKIYPIVKKEDWEELKKEGSKRNILFFRI